VKTQLGQVDFFRNVSDETLEGLWAAGSEKTYKKADVLFRAREPVERVFVQMTGKSIIYNLTQTGKRKILFIFGAGMLLNEHIQTLHNASTYCEVIEESQIFVVPSDVFLRYMESDFLLTKAVLMAHEKKIWRLGHQLKNTMGSIYVERKLAAKLWKLARDFGIQTPEGIQIDINMSVTFLADMLGTPRETASKACSTLVGAGLIQMEKKRITVTNPQKMALFYKTGEIMQTDEGVSCDK
jgi:CRP-like cAMP-binding protein